MAIGNRNRAVGSNNMNLESSRSHSLFCLTLAMNNHDDGSCKVGKLYLVDLAGSEKVAKTGASGETLEEAKSINKSLTTLGKVILALTDKKSTHIPYRESKLTRMLSESLGGNSKTCMVITCSPHSYNAHETLSTLQFGARARNIQNAPKINKEYTVPELKRLLEKAELKIEALQTKIKVLLRKIQELGGPLPTDEELEGLARQLMLDAEEKEKGPSMHASGPATGENRGADEDQLFSPNARDAYIESRETEQMVRSGAQDGGAAVDPEALAEKQDEIDRLRDLVEQKADALKEA